jgi:acetyl-CoA carboxylase biotin carboxyl carrier protein
VAHVTAHSAPAALPAAPAPASAPAAAPAEEVGIHYITSPIVGTFYRASNPTSAPFVSPGDFVKPGQTLCIVEAMKLMNEIECDVAGEVVKVLVENGQPVEYGEKLYAIRVG